MAVLVEWLTFNGKTQNEDRVSSNAWRVKGDDGLAHETTPRMCFVQV